MIKYIIGIDGGGSKTRFLCVNRNGEKIGTFQGGSSYYRQEGISAVIEILKRGICECVNENIEFSELAICFGMPGYGEDVYQDREAVNRITEALAPIKICFENDVAAGWSGALALLPGVCIVAGTGSMSYGQDAEGRIARSGGWSEFFSDEGSGYWLGRKLLMLFAQQSDGRLCRTAIYDLVRKQLKLNADFDIIALTERKFLHSRKNTADLQKILLKAARLGDEMAMACYRQAAWEISRILSATVRKLSFPKGELNISYAGGLFQIQDLILEPVKQYTRMQLPDRILSFMPPLLSPEEGAALFAVKNFLPELLTDFRNTLLCKDS